MSSIAQYMTVFLANLTTDRDSTPDCSADSRTLCNQIQCTIPSNGEHYNYTFLECEEPIIFSIRHTFEDGTEISFAKYTESQPIPLTGMKGAYLTFNHLDLETVQLQVHNIKLAINL